MTLVRFQPAPFPQLLSEFLNPSLAQAQRSQPAVNVIQTPTGFRLEVAAPGLAKEDFQLKMEKNVLTISAHKEQAQLAEGARFQRREFSFTAFERAFRLPESVDTDRVDAGFKNGILMVTLLNKPETKPEVKTIPID
ncbi:MAG: Hsp20/alpha crystallin family protein [Saprospiraceae bacterium]|nr:Hsp20/alpha crystallin family protein [Saprospiraceae bacterium]